MTGKGLHYESKLTNKFRGEFGIAKRSSLLYRSFPSGALDIGKLPASPTTIRLGR